MCDLCHHSYCKECADLLSCDVCGEETFLCQRELKIRRDDPCGCGDQPAVVCETCHRSSHKEVEKQVEQAQEEGDRQIAMSRIRDLAQTFGIPTSDLVSWLSSKATQGPDLRPNT
jgi:hypothetical protein